MGFRFVSAAEFDTFLRAYPRPLIIDPPLERKALFRIFQDPTLGSFPQNVVAKWHAGRRNALCEIRDDLP
jgi:hypothetical protein